MHDRDTKGKPLSSGVKMKMTARRLLILLVFGAVTAHGDGDVGRASASAQIIVSPQEALIDQRVSVSLTGLEPRQRVTLTAVATDAATRQWKSTAVFQAGRRGTVTLDRTAPIAGDYLTADAMGPFWSMSPVDGRKGGLFSRGSLPSYRVHLELSDERGLLASTDVIRRFCSPDITVREIREAGLVGRMWIPAGQGHRPSILLLTGGSGGIQTRYGPLLASHGYTVFSLAYFGIEPLPQRQVEIPLEYFDRALAWMKTQAEVDPERIGVMGSSKGGEASLLLAATFDSIKAVIAFAGSSVVWEGAMERRNGSVVDPLAYKSGWTFQGKPLPYLPKTASEEATRRVMADPAQSRALFEPALSQKALVEKAAIPVERIHGPVLLFSGKDDVAWPSTPMSDMVIARLRRFHYRWPFRHVAYDSAGHLFEDGYLPTPAFSAVQGGTPAGNAHAQADSWRLVLKFLADHLTPR